jgi:3-hydroxybutyryl-CoA dehydrogenase
MSKMETVAVIGSGYMGGGIAQAFAIAGHTVLLADADLPSAKRAVDRLIAEGAARAARGIFPADAEDRLTERLKARSLDEAVGEASYVSEAVPEQIDLKHRVLAEVSSAAASETVIATNTSAIPIGELAQRVERPERFLGVHWMNPSYFVPGVEVIPTPETKPQIVDDVLSRLARIGKSPTVVADSPGFVGNRLQYALYLEAAKMVEEEVATPEQIDEVVKNSFGFRLPFFGPFAISDIAGLDVYSGSFVTMERAFGSRFEAPKVLLARVSSGRLGVKSGEGFYRYVPEDAERLAAYRDTAYWRLAALREELEGLDEEVPGL